jgi:hypothetical protein
MPSLIQFGADTLAALGTISPATADALKAEAGDRINSRRLFGHIGYASIVATRTN